MPRIVVIIDEFQMMFGDDNQTRQKIADMLEDRSTLEETQRAAKEIMARDPELSSPESAALKNEIQRLFDAVGSAGMN